LRTQRCSEISSTYGIWACFLSQSPARNTALKRIAAYSQITFTDNSSFRQCHRYAAAENWHITGSGRRHKAGMRQSGRDTLSTRATSAKRRRCDSLTSSGLPPFSTRRRLMSSIVAFSSSCACYCESHEQENIFPTYFPWQVRAPLSGAREGLIVQANTFHEAYNPPPPATALFFAAVRRLQARLFTYSRGCEVPGPERLCMCVYARERVRAYVCVPARLSA